MNKEQSLATTVASYELVAREYYDTERHPTCANFRDASRILFKRWLSEFNSRSLVCEIGAGKSLIAEILFEANQELSGLVLVDESHSMLAYSERWRRAGVKLELASAMDLACASESFDAVASCLGDPYNTPSFWREVHRILRPGGKCLFTTPSRDWAVAFRDGSNQDSMHSSEFELADRSRVFLPSHIYSEADQIELIQSVGLKVLQVSGVSIQDLSGNKLSPKLLLSRGQKASVVTGYLALKE